MKLRPLSLSLQVCGAFANVLVGPGCARLARAHCGLADVGDTREQCALAEPPDEPWRRWARARALEPGRARRVFACSAPLPRLESLVMVGDFEPARASSGGAAWRDAVDGARAAAERAREADGPGFDVADAPRLETLVLHHAGLRAVRASAPHGALRNVSLRGRVARDVELAGCAARSRASSCRG